MSVEKQRREALRWLRQTGSDLEDARALEAADQAEVMASLLARHAILMGRWLDGPLIRGNARMIFVARRGQLLRGRTARNFDILR